MKAYSKNLQNERARLYHEAYAARLKTTDIKATVNPRERVWVCFTLFEMGQDALANDLLRTVEMNPCAFMPMNLTELLVTYGDRIDADVRQRCKDYILSRMDHLASPGIHIVTYNDNFALMAIYTLIVGGELFDLPQYVQAGAQKLDEVAELLTRCGTVMEYSSGTYTPIDIIPLAQIFNHSKNEALRKLALDCEHRLWADVVSHYHPTTAQLAGPHSRSYPVDMLGHPHLYCALMWKMFGDAVFVNPMNSWFPVISDNLHIHVSLDGLSLPNCAWLINADYHCPGELSRLIYERTYPYVVEQTVECLPSNDFKEAEDHDKGFGFLAPGHRSTNYTYMLPEYSMGTAENQYHSGVVTDSFFLTYRHAAQPKDIRDVGTATCRYIFNDKVLCQPNEYACFGVCSKDGHRDEGRKFAIQNKNISMVLYKPYHFEKDAVSSAKLTVNFTTHFGNPLKVYAGDTAVDLQAGYESTELTPVIVETPECWFGLLPTAVSDLGRTKAVDIREANNFVTVAFYNYCGDTRSFTAEELIHAQNGFICVAGTKNEYTLETFRAHLAQCVLTEDRMERKERVWMRRTHFKSPDTELRLQVCPLGDTVMVSTANRKPRGTVIFSATDIDNSALPFLD